MLQDLIISKSFTVFESAKIPNLIILKLREVHARRQCKVARLDYFNVINGFRERKV